MKCREFERWAAEMAREEVMNTAAVAHAKTCLRCARRLANERMLSGIVAAAVAEDSERVAPPEVEKRLIAAFRKQLAASQPRRRALWTGAAVAAIAAAVIVTAVVSLHRTAEPPKAQVKPPQAYQEPVRVPVAVPAVREVRKPRLRTLRASRRNPVGPSKPQAMEADREHMTEFIPVFYDPEPIEQGQIVRVRLPRAALTAFGLPVNEEHAEEKIRADVLLGEDGLARAVRFVK